MRMTTKDNKQLLTFTMTRQKAKEMDLLLCGSCGWRENNHFDFDERVCAHDKGCTGYVETSRKGVKLVKKKV